MDANLDARIKISGLEAYNAQNVDIKDNYDGKFLALYEDILSEADRIKKEVVVTSVKTDISKKISDKKKIVLVESILSDIDETFLRNVYIKVLGREPDRAGYDNYLKKIKNDQDFDREQLIYNFWKSDEGQKRNIEVIGFHRVYMDELLSHDGIDFVEHAFLQLLARKPNQEDSQGYYNYVYRQGKSKEDAIKKIKESEEGKRKRVEIVGFEKAYKKRKRKEKILATPIVGNAALTLYNIIHLNRRLKEITDKLGEDQTTIKELKEQVLSSNRIIEEQKAQIDEMSSKLESIYNPETEVDYLERLNLLLSGRMTVWGPKDRLSISYKSSVYTCFFNTNSGFISVGDYTFAGSNVSILAGSHDKNLKGLARRDADITEGCDIVIGNGVWLGSNSTILGPATIGDNAVIAAGAVVVPGTIVPPNTVYGGIPAKQIGEELSFDDEFSESLLKALDRKDGVLFTDGWSEKSVFDYKGSNTLGYYLLEKVGKILIEAGDYRLKYSHSGEELTVIYIDDGTEKTEYVLREKEGEIEFTVNPPSDNSLNCRYISISTLSGAKTVKSNELIINIER